MAAGPITPQSPGCVAPPSDRVTADLRLAIRRSVVTLRKHLRLCRDDPTLLIYAELHERALAFIATQERAAQRPAELDELMDWLIQIASHWRIHSKHGGRALQRIVNRHILLAGSARPAAPRKVP